MAEKPRPPSPDDAYGEKPPVQEGSESRGSSVSSRLEEEYDQVLKSAVLMPNVESIPAIVEQFLGQVARDVDTYPPGHAFSSARLVDVSDDENPRTTIPNQSSTRPPSNLQIGSEQKISSAMDFIDVMGKELSATNSSSEHDQVSQSNATTKQTTKSYFEQTVSETSTTETDPLYKYGALPRQRFVPEKPVQQIQPKSRLKQSPKKTQQKSNLMYSARMKNDDTAVSGGSALEQLVNTGGDDDLVRTENLMDQWCGELKRNILAEFGQAKCRIAGNYHFMLSKEKEKHKNEMRQLREETDSVRELLATYEISLSRKDQVISNLTQSLHRHRDRLEMQRRFAEWRQQHTDRKREAFCSKLAAQHYERTLYRQIWNAWHSLLVGKWRHRVERACQAKAQEVCLQLTNDYEAKIASANEALEASRAEVEKLHRERDWYEENMKKAFMRGVCALNMEALGMFRPPEEQNDIEDDCSENIEECIEQNNSIFGAPPVYPSNAAPVYTVNLGGSYQQPQPQKTTARCNRKSACDSGSATTKVVRARFSARDIARPASTGACRGDTKKAASKTTVPRSPSLKSRSNVTTTAHQSLVGEYSKKVHFSMKN